MPWIYLAELGDNRNLLALYELFLSGNLPRNILLTVKFERGGEDLCREVGPICFPCRLLWLYWKRYEGTPTEDKATPSKEKEIAMAHRLLHPGGKDRGGVDMWDQKQNRV